MARTRATVAKRTPAPVNDEPVPRSGRGRGEEEMTEEELAFVRAIDDYKRRNHRPFPTWREVLRIAKSLGYKRVPTAP